MPSGRQEFYAPLVIVAAGALQTPLLLQRSACDGFAGGIANGSGLVGKNLMRHLIDLWLVLSVFNLRKAKNHFKDFAWNDFYEVDGVKYGTVQPFGRFTDTDGGGRPLVRRLANLTARPQSFARYPAISHAGLGLFVFP